MNKQNLIIYDFNELFSILIEIKSNLNFNLLNVSKKEFSELKFNKDFFVGLINPLFHSFEQSNLRYGGCLT